MELQAALDPIVAIIAGVGWFIVKALMNRRNDMDSWDEFEQPRPKSAPPLPAPAPAPSSPPAPPVIRPAPVIIVQAPPPVIPKPAPVVIQQPDLARMEESRRAYERAARIDDAVAKRLSEIDETVAKHKRATAQKRRNGVEDVIATMRNPATARNAVLAAVILNPPKSMEPL